MNRDSAVVTAEEGIECFADDAVHADDRADVEHTGSAILLQPGGAVI